MTAAAHNAALTGRIELPEGNMKGTDIGGFAAILVAGYIVGRDNAAGEFSSMDLFLIVGLLALGWYLAVKLS